MTGVQTCALPIYLTARIHLKRNNPLLSEKELICPQLPPLQPPPRLLLQYQTRHQPNLTPQLSLNELELPSTSHDADMLSPQEEEEVEILALLEEEEDRHHQEEEDHQPHPEEEELDHRQSPLHK